MHQSSLCRWKIGKLKGEKTNQHSRTANMRCSLKESTVFDSDESDSILSPPKKSKYEAACNSSARLDILESEVKRLKRKVKSLENREKENLQNKEEFNNISNGVQGLRHLSMKTISSYQKLIRSAYQLCGRDVADAIIYHGLSDYLEVSRAYNDMGHFIKKMTNLELELKRLENKDGIGAAATRVVEEVLPTTKGGRSSTQNSNINTKARAKAAKGARTSMIIADGCVQDITIPGEVASLDTNMPLASIKSVQQMNLDNRMHRHMNEYDLKSSALTESGLKRTGPWKSMMTIDEDTIEELLDNIIQKIISTNRIGVEKNWSLEIHDDH
ncbi:unnamed protein product [Mytilus edulis]|uniref:Uncharacterized protein n=1 Tax=Mytilus edulis TaxID=6550 RepID=A0A8S3RZW1_MYTED|nr:unnamed protein product [Mytilus edulis]